MRFKNSLATSKREFDNCCRAENEPPLIAIIGFMVILLLTESEGTIDSKALLLFSVFLTVSLARSHFFFLN